ncbi:FAD binding domain-containing protein [Rhodoplanes sp. Z2-YC6860]|uniref:FAD binding domain-containing protein n=1 Tax=Rhodoplanes sp. Z2-YC6860 TaxID=674703 RepID=UPI00078D699D|nr:FAD binding domain-containing protein [Rhodoplanes sp. Z2-YC6860]AMN40668.1 FAD-binding molybdopterin dehydrogenase [Rhodoplanes sp. Z2-YC6860]
MKARAFLYRRPDSIDEALALLADTDGAQVLAGGQSLMPTLNMRLSSPEMLVDINRIEALRGIDDRSDKIRIGALVRHAEVLESKVIAERVPLMAMAIPHVAHMAVRNRGTTCGSLALADPSAEMPAIAVALDAGIVLRKRGAERSVSARTFFQGLYQTARNDDEMIAEVMLPAAQPDEVFGFSELSRRHGDFATVGVAVRARKAPGGLGELNVVFFGSEPTPLLSRSARGLTVDANSSDEALSEIASSIAKDMNPIDSHQGRGETKRRQAAVLLVRTLKDMIVRAAHV